MLQKRWKPLGTTGTSNTSGNTTTPATPPRSRVIGERADEKKEIKYYKDEKNEIEMSEEEKKSFLKKMVLRFI